MPDGTIKRRRRRAPDTMPEETTLAEEVDTVQSEGRPKRECPVPKPGGLVRQMMGLEQKAREPVPQVIVQSLRAHGKTRQGGGDDADEP
ncbi:hypothetical protein B0A54_10406 [Friedmanniomyces endolithicus]|uniref:Uncharacterized protein n=1 Tax=Friedmanniomyces endolithicus TaxID=329885 RepID=A0A4U0UTS4_9PEZI|nr:hypothetical protein B0A54_10406 [Friedmanniomyces endolithicus]